MAHKNKKSLIRQVQERLDSMLLSVKANIKIKNMI